MKFKKITKTLLYPLSYMAVFWIFMDILPNTLFRGGPVSKVIASFGYFLAFQFGVFLLSFFKLGKNVLARFMTAAAATAGYIWLADKYTPDILDINPTYVGNSDLVLFQLPKLLELNDPVSIAIFSGIILVFCSIIIERSAKRTY